MSRTILVTAAGGFIGSHTAQALVRRRDAVVEFDNLGNYCDPALERASLKDVQSDLAHESRFTFISRDVRDRALLSQLLDQHPIDTDIHLAGTSVLRVSMQNPHLDCDVNLIGALNLLDMARDQKVDRFFLASASSAYGRPRRIPFAECDNPLALTLPENGLPKC